MLYWAKTGLEKEPSKLQELKEYNVKIMTIKEYKNMIK